MMPSSLLTGGGEVETSYKNIGQGGTSCHQECKKEITLGQRSPYFQPFTRKAEE